MKLTFESHLEYQMDAVRSVTDLFSNQLHQNTSLHQDLSDPDFLHSMLAVGNQIMLTSEQILESMNVVQNRNGLPLSNQLDGMHFSVEMETGTGKTYVYLRTIYELNHLYHFKKFIITVPSIAIREGVLKNLEITHEHFQGLYNNVPLRFRVYDSDRVSSLRSFASNDHIEILVINIDSFTRDENVINKPNDKLNGRKPLEFIQAVRPIVIVDEPQNMETQKRISAIENLNYLFTLRYSATHRNLYNLVYSLSPVDAYDLGLVKQVEVDSVTEENAYNDAFVKVHKITTTRTKVKATISMDVNGKSKVERRRFSVEVGTDLYELSNGREIYSKNHVIENIDATNECITLSSGNTLFVGDSQGGLSEEIMKYQIQKTIEEHLKKEKRFSNKGIKVLTLFFIDQVSNYREYDHQGNPKYGKFAEWFEDIYTELISKSSFKELDIFSVSQVHGGYFSRDRKGHFKDTSGATIVDHDTYGLIMRDKEKLLEIGNPLRFIFSHSALREGWDNPNVFQICTLNKTQSDLKKRQEIGRGLRLAVDATGRRIYDQNINRLTIIANESYEDFAKTLQKEIEEDCGISFSGRVKKKKDRKPVEFRKDFETNEKFMELWAQINKKTTYQVDYDRNELIRTAANIIQELPVINAPKIRSVKTALVMKSSHGIDGQLRGFGSEEIKGYTWEIPEILGEIQSRTQLTRSTIYDILCECNRMEDILINPQLFIDLVSKTIQQTLHSMMIDGIKYQQVGDQEYEMTLFEDQELEVFINDYTFLVPDSSKSIYEEFIPLDSEVEHQFAHDCESSDQIKFYLKLPKWFKIETPIGSYNPDWALVHENSRTIYFVAETKNTGASSVDLSKLRLQEQLKIKCAEAHFKEFDSIHYKVVAKVEHLSSPE